MNEVILNITPALSSALCALLTALTGYLITYINKKKKALQQEMDNEMADKYLEMLSITIVDCVTATNQTFVEALKKENAFTEEAQKEAFVRTYNNVMAILNEDCYEYLAEITSDVETYIINKIEAEVNFAKA